MGKQSKLIKMLVSFFIVTSNLSFIPVQATTFSKGPEVQLDLPKFVQVEAARTSSYGIDENGTLYAWGSNNYGQLGDGTLINRSIPVPVLDHVLSVVTDGYTTYAIRKDLTLWTWGIYQVPNNVSSISKIPVKIMDDVLEVQIGFENAFAIKTDSTLWFWGSNEYAHLSPNSRSTSPLAIQQIMTNVSSMCISPLSAFVIQQDGNLWSWGSNEFGQLGNIFPDYVYGQRNNIMDNVESVSSYFSHTLIIKKDHTLWGWGSNESGQLGIGTTVKSYVSVKIMDNVAFAKAYTKSSSVIKLDGSLWTFGNNENKQLGLGNTLNQLYPNQILTDVDQNIGSHGALLNDGSLWMWGTNASGELGNGTIIDPSGPIKILSNVIDVATTDAYTLAVKEDGSLMVWGSNDYGQLGLGTTSAVTTKVPTQVIYFSTYKQNVIATPETFPVEFKGNTTSGTHYVVDSEGTLWAWGNNDYATIGDGTLTSKTHPLQIMKNVTLFKINGNTPYAIQSDGSLWTWGGVKKSPVKILDNVKDVSSGTSHILALLNDGSLMAWGGNSRGQLGDGTTTTQTTPILILSNVKAIDAADYHSFAILEDDSLWSWGTNTYGILGIGSTAEYNATPTKVMENVASIKSSVLNATVLTTDGEFWIWGASDVAYVNSKVPFFIASNVKSIQNPRYYITNDNVLFKLTLNYSGIYLRTLTGDAQSITSKGEDVFVLKMDHTVVVYKYSDYYNNPPFQILEGVSQIDGAYVSFGDGRFESIVYSADYSTKTVTSIFDFNINKYTSLTTEVNLTALEKTLLVLDYDPESFDKSILYKVVGTTDVATITKEGLITALKTGTFTVKITNLTETITYQEIDFNVGANALLVGVTDQGNYNHDVKISFENATATLNDVTIESGTLVSNEGEYSLVLTDLLGKALTLEFTIDKTAPIITLGDYVTSPTADNVVVTATTNEGVLNTESYTYLDNGSFTFVAVDLAGNRTVQTLVIDNIVRKPSQVKNLHFTYVGNGRMDLAWDASTMIDESALPITYRVYYEYTGTFIWSYKTTSSTSYSMTGLINGRSYQYYIVAVDSKSRVSDDSAKIFSSPALDVAPTVPGSFKITEQKDGKLSLSWNASTDINENLNGYVISYQLSGSSTILTKTVDKDTTETELTGLSNGSTYLIKLRAYDSKSLYSGYTATLSGVPQVATAPSSVLGFTVTTINDTSVGFKWNASTDINLNLSHYVIKIVDNALPDESTTLEINASTLNGLATGLELGHEYEFSIRAVDSTDLTSNASNTLTVTTISSEAPSQVTGLKVTYQSLGYLELKWDPSTDVNNDIVRYEISYIDSFRIGGRYTVSSTTTSRGISMNLLYFGSSYVDSYDFEVTAIDSLGQRSTFSTTLVVKLTVKVPLVAPVGFSVARQGNGTVVLSWDGNSSMNPGLKQYVITYTRSGYSTVYTKVVSSSSSSVAITGLVNGATYSFRARSQDTLNVYSAYSATVTAKPQIDVGPSAVTGLKLTYIGEDYFEIYWNKSVDPNLDVKNYLLYVQDQRSLSNPWIIYTIDGTSNDNLIYGFETNVTYAMKVKTVDSLGNASAFSSVITATPVPDAAPSDVSGLKVINQGPASITLQWNASTDVNLNFDHYEISYQSVGSDISMIVNSLTNSITISGLTNEQGYEFKVRAVDTSLRNTEYTDVVTATPHLNTAPSIPSTLKVERQGNTAVDLSWAASTDTNLNLKYYVITYTRSGYSTVYTVNVLPTSTSVTISKLVNGATYTFKLRALDTTNLYSAYANIVTAKPQVDVAPSAISGFKITHLGNGTLALAWTSSSDLNLNFKEYVISLQDTSSVSNPWVEYKTGSNTLTIDGLDNGTEYAVKMKAIDKMNLSTATSVVLKGTPSLEVSPNNISGFKATNQGPTTITIGWTPAIDANLDLKNIHVFSRVFGTSEWTETLVTSSSATFTALSNEVTYEYQVQAEDNLGNLSEKSEIITATPHLNTAPSTPSTLKVYSKVTGTLVLSWDVSTDINLNLKQYELTYTRAGYTTVTKKIILAGTNKITLTGLVVGSTYTYKLRALDATNLYSSYSNTLVIKQ